MTTTCANCRAEVGDAAYCPQCGHAVLSPQSAPPDLRAAEPDWRTDTSERPAARAPVEPPPRRGHPGSAALPAVRRRHRPTASRRTRTRTHAPTPPPPEPTSYLDDQDLDDDYERRMVPAWLPWVLVALMLLLVAVGGVWLLLSPGRRLRHGFTGRVGPGLPGDQ